jgi:hypothetical protein
MHARTLLVAGIALCVVAFVPGGESTADAAPPAAPPAVAPRVEARPELKVNVENCQGVAADLTMKVVSGVEAFSQGSYGHPDCPAFVTDFQIDSNSAKVEANSGKSPKLVFDGRDTVRETSMDPYSASTYHYYMKVTEAECTSHKHQVHVYRKKSGEAAFTLLGGGSLAPTWNAKGLGFGPVCLLAPGPGFVPIPQVLPPSSGTDVVRVVVFVPGAPGQMAASAMHPHV